MEKDIRQDKQNRHLYFIIILILVASLVAIIVLYADAKKQLETQAEMLVNHDSLIETVEVLQRDDIQRLITYAKKVMAGEIVVERGDNLLYLYSYNSHAKEYYTNLDKIEVSLAVIEAHVDGDRGELKMIYRMRYLDSSNRLLRLSGASREFPSMWTIE